MNRTVHKRRSNQYMRTAFEIKKNPTSYFTREYPYPGETSNNVVNQHELDFDEHSAEQRDEECCDGEEDVVSKVEMWGTNNDTEDYDSCGEADSIVQSSSTKNMTRENHDLMYCDFILSNGLSKATSSQLDELMERIYGSPPITSSLSAWKNIEKQYGNLLEWRCFNCIKCAHPLNDKAAQCSNFNCDLYKIPQKCSSDLTASTSLYFKITKQAEHHVTDFLENIVKHHRDFHMNKKANENVKYLATGTVRDSRKYFEKIETELDFQKNTVVLPYTVFIDGALAKHVSRSELTSAVLRLDSLPAPHNQDQRRLIMIAFNQSRGGLNHATSVPFISKMVENLKSFEMKKLEVKIKEETWTVKFRMLGMMGDYKGYNLLSPLPNWMKSYGCMTCTIPGLRFGRGLSFSSSVPFPLRSEELTIEHLESRSHGFEETREKPVIFTLCPLEIFLHDELHLLYEGAFKYFIDEFYASKAERKFKNSKLKIGRLEALEDALRKTLPYTHSNTTIPTLASRNRITGSERKLLGSLLFTLCFITEAFDSSQYGCLLLVFGLTPQYCHNENQIDNLGDLLKLAGILHDNIERTRCPLKYHSIYWHWIDQLRNYSISMEGSVFEKFHSRINNFVPRTSRDPEDITKRVILQANCSLRLNEKTNEDDERSSSSGHEMMHPIELIMARKNFADEIEFIENLGYNVDDCQFYTGASVRSMGKMMKYGASKMNPKKTQKSFVKFNDGSCKLCFFGKCRLFFEIHRQKLVLLSRYKTKTFEECSAPIRKKLLESNPTTSLNVLNKCISMKPQFEKIVGFGYFIAPLKFIISPCLVIPYQNEVYITMTR